MRYEEFRDVLLAKGYSIVDVFDCIRDFFRSDACSGAALLSLNEHVALYCDHIYNRFEREKKHYDLDDCFNKLVDMYNIQNNNVYCDLCYDIWDFCRLDSSRFDDYWQDLLKDC
jgi:hypothetical protein